MTRATHFQETALDTLRISPEPSIYTIVISLALRRTISSTLSKVSHFRHGLIADGRVRIIDQNSGTRAIAVTPSSSAVISLTIQDGFDSEESFLLVLDLTHDLTIWSIKPWRIDSSDVP